VNADVVRRLCVLAVSTLAAQSQLAPLKPIELAVKGTYQRLFGQSIERPAIYNTSPECQAQRANLTTTAYLQRSGKTSRLLSMYTTFDGSDSARIGNSIVLTPAGTIRVLVAFFRYPETVSVDAVNDWTRGQAQINDDHVAFAKKQGYATPIVTFNNTNVVIDSTATGTVLQDGSALDPRSPQSVRLTLQQRGFVLDDYELVISIDMHPSRFAGGVSINASRFIHVGNYFRRTSPLSARDWMFVARTAYHHEVPHQWGWPGTHDWSAPCETTRTEPFIVPPMLLGWEDTDGDHIPEILDETPYGRSGL
jgi:hypothetical protein